ncbi:MAG TPA: outer membrane beta-barrel protein, partial [Thermoguttaceae bacterium]|nr:outer membrane beta-barrel protein [Thermoguttaceae bacterium]
LNNLPGARGWAGSPGYAGNFNALTMGLNWKPKANLTVRPEIRWDRYDGQANAAGPHPLPFNNGTSNDQLTIAADVILTF